VDYRLSAKPAALATLKNAYRAAVLNLSSGGALNEARGKVGIALSNIMRGLPTKEKIDEVKSAIDAWIKELEGSL
jgi:dihydroxyacetone kinase-like predicted kinase